MFLHPWLPLHCLIYSLWYIYTLIFHQFINVAVGDLDQILSYRHRAPI